MKWPAFIVSDHEDRKYVARDLRILRNFIPMLVRNSSGFHLIPLSRNETVRHTALMFRLTDQRGGLPSKHRALAFSVYALARDGTKHPLDDQLLDAAMSYGAARVEDFARETVALLRKRAHADSIERELLVRYCDATGAEFHR